MSIGTFFYDRDIILAALSLLISMVLLGVYMWAVKRSMRRRAAQAGDFAEADASPSGGTAPAASEPLRIVETETPPKAIVRSVWSGVTEGAVVQIIAGLAYSVSITAAWMWLATQQPGWQGVDWRGAAMFVLFFAWPLVIVLGLIATISWRGKAIIVFGYALLLASVALYLMQGTPITPAYFALGWWKINGAATLFVLAMLIRPIRAMGPIVAALVVAGAAGVFGLAFSLDEISIEWIGSVATGLGLSGRGGGVVVAVVVFGAAGVAALLAGYVVLRGIGWLYRMQWVSDRSIQVDAVWLTFAVLQAPGGMLLEGLIAFLVYKAAVIIVERLFFASHEEPSDAPRLLLLRVFSLGSRSSRLFDAFSQLWRTHGSLRMIAGPDLANATIAPHEFLDFLAGRLQRRFIDSPQTLDRRLTEAEPVRDTDGRYRVAAFFCHADTWQMVLRRLSRESDRVLMDLRGFSRESEGCVFELEELLDAVDLRRVLLIVDATTDETFLGDVVQRGWQRTGQHSPNRRQPDPHLRLFRMAPGANGDVGRLVATVTRLGC